MHLVGEDIDPSRVRAIDASIQFSHFSRTPYLSWYALATPGITVVGRSVLGALTKLHTAVEDGTARATTVTARQIPCGDCRALPLGGGTVSGSN